MTTNEILENIKLKLVTGELQPGTKLKPGALQAAYGCSANTLRDILMRLCHFGLVEFEFQRGFRATPNSQEQRRDLTYFRLLLEKEGAERSMANGGVAWEAQLAAAHHKLLHIETQMASKEAISANRQLWIDADREFHESLIAACGSAILVRQFGHVIMQFRQQLIGLHRKFDNRYFEAIIREHQAIVDAALARDAQACGDAIYRHLERNL